MNKSNKESDYTSVALRVTDVTRAKEIVDRERLAGNARFARTNKNYEYASTFIGLVVRNYPLPPEALDSQAIRAWGYSPTAAEPKSPVDRTLLPFIVEHLRAEVCAIKKSIVVIARDYSDKPMLWMVPVGEAVHIVGTNEAARCVVKLAKAVAPLVPKAEATAKDEMVHFVVRANSPAEASDLAEKIKTAFCPPPAPKVPVHQVDETENNEPLV